MAINIVRFAPNRFVPTITDTKENNRFAQFANNTDELKSTLKKLPRLNPVRVDKQAMKAC